MPIKIPEEVVHGVEYGIIIHSLMGVGVLKEEDEDSNEGQ